MSKTISFKFEKETKNTLRFTEEVATNLDTPVIGTIYVQKATLKALDYTDGNSLVVTVEVK